jgi:hypothetical protein
MYDVSLLANASSLAAQSSVLQHFMLYDSFLQQERLKIYNALLFSQNTGAASLVNPFMVPGLNPPVVYIPTPGSERMANVGQSELGISEVLSCALPSQKNASGQISPSGTGQLAAGAYVPAEDSAGAPATFDTHTALESESQVDFESQYESDATDLSSSEYIYRYVNPCTTEGRNNTVNEAFQTFMYP